MAALTPQDSVWRLIMLVAAGLLACVYIIATIRRPRRENQNPIPTEPHTIKLWKVEFPELKHLPEAERERLLQNALQNPEVKNFQNRTRKVFGIIFYTTMAIFLTIAVTSDVPAWLLTVISVPALLGIMITTVFIRTQLELKIIRRLLKELN
jgi:hypothetical protein